MPLYFLIPFIILIISWIPRQESFKEQQMRYPRVRASYSEKFPALRKELDSLGIGDFDLFIRAFKVDEEFEVWIKNKNEEHYQLFRTYDICSSSGRPGPKRRRGDLQVPEGFYHINVFNPYSNFYLSLGINYPNRSDRILSKADYPGGDIYIHGSCVTIGCIPLTDEIIKELYVLAVEARTSRQDRIPVHIFPTRLHNNYMENLYYLAEGDPDLLSFWMNLKEGFDYFEIHLTLPEISVDDSGTYIIR